MALIIIMIIMMMMMMMMIIIIIIISQAQRLRELLLAFSYPVTVITKVK
jgi:hypothetical protein